jgi:glycosyltransferase involved in cell wall biosynthesis
MNALQICPRPFPALGGPAKTYRQFYQAIGARALGFVAPDDGVNEEPVVPLVSVVRTLGGKGIHGYYYASSAQLRDAEAAIASAGIVFLHGLFTHPTAWASRVCRRRGVSYVVILHGMLDPWALRKSRFAKQLWLRIFGSAILANAAAVVCATHREAQKAAPLLGRTARTSVIGWACETPDISKIGLGRDGMRRNLGFGESDRVLVYLGRLHSMKRPIETVRILAGLGNPNLKLLMIGPDDDVSKAKLEAEARELGWSGLRVVGPVFGSEKFDYLRAGDGFISLSHRENFNYGLAEAMSTGLSPILSPGNDLGWEFAGDGFSSQLKTDDPAEAAGAVDGFLRLSDDKLWQRGAAARDWTEKNLGMNSLRQNLENLVRAGAMNGRTGRC